MVKWDKDCIVHCALVAMIVQCDKDFRTSHESAPANLFVLVVLLLPLRLGASSTLSHVETFSYVRLLADCYTAQLLQLHRIEHCVHQYNIV